MKQISIFLFAIFVLLSGCSKDAMEDQSPTIQEDNTTMVSQERSNDFDCPPFTLEDEDDLTCEGVTRTLKIHRAAGTIGPDPEPPAWCTDGFPLLVEGSSNMSHLGQATVRIQWCFGSTTVPPMGEVEAANGDKIFMVYTGGIPQDGWQHYTVINGTGRFEDACGFWDLCGPPVEFDPVTATGSWSHEGIGLLRY